MSAKVFRSAVLGGLVVFVWMLLSWMLFPWHRDAMHRFTDESKVADVIKDYAPESGMYVIPFAHCEMSKSCAGSKDDLERSKKMMERGPVVFAAVHVNGMERKPAVTMIVGLIINMLGAWGITHIVTNMKAMNYQKKVAHVTLMGLIIGLLGVLPGWNWGAITASYAFPMFCDYIIGWFFAGLVIGKLSK